MPRTAAEAHGERLLQQHRRRQYAAAPEEDRCDAIWAYILHPARGWDFVLLDATDHEIVSVILLAPMTPDVLDRLAMLPRAAVQMEVVEHRGVSAETLGRLVHDGVSGEVRMAAHCRFASMREVP